MSKALTNPKADKLQKITPMPEFNAARKHIANITEHGRRMQHESVLLGLELNRLKDTIGAKHGGDRKSSCHDANLIAWDELVKQQTGYSYETCQRWMKIAQGAQKSIPLLTASDVLKKPFHSLPEKRQMEIVKVLQKAVDGQTMAELAVTFKVCKPGRKAPPPGGKSAKNDFKGGAANRDSELDPAAMRQLALENGNALRDMREGKAHEFLEDDELSALHAMLDGWTQDVAKLIEQRKHAEAKAGGKKR